MLDGVGQVRRVLREGLYYVRPDLVAPRLPGPIGQFVRRILAEEAHRVPALRREPFLRRALDVRLHERLPGWTPPLAVLPRLLQIIYRRVDDYAPRVLRSDISTG